MQKRKIALSALVVGTLITATVYADELHTAIAATRLNNNALTKYFSSKAEKVNADSARDKLEAKAKKEEEAKRAAEEKAKREAEIEKQKAAEEAAKKAEEERLKKEAEEKAKAEELAAQEAQQEATTQSNASTQAIDVSYGSINTNGSSSIVQESTMEYTLNDFLYAGRISWGGYTYTYYSERVLPGNGLNIPGRTINENGYVVDGDGYIVLANDAPIGTVFPTPFGGPGKVYDRGTVGNHLDVYVR